ncbi:hypothetical protein EJ08DRAFT_44226 [Tothia fuscella]|uniref:Uncharacterized protein n=1 Tax=Tothia fuscella TaxID=1048955 RepID=A0A9P4NFV8_9PEZI|nr:hypothetical protein EJ08DRAFT_44226 [Tothia fuscella]
MAATMTPTPLSDGQNIKASSKTGMKLHSVKHASNINSKLTAWISRPFRQPAYTRKLNEKDAESSPLLRLPRELRDQIYRWLLVHPGRAIKLERPEKKHRLPVIHRAVKAVRNAFQEKKDGEPIRLDTNILRVNKQIYAEAFQILMENRVSFSPPREWHAYHASDPDHPKTTCRGCQKKRINTCATLTEIKVLKRASQLEIKAQTWQLDMILNILAQRPYIHFLNIENSPYWHFYLHSSQAIGQPQTVEEVVDKFGRYKLDYIKMRNSSKGCFHMVVFEAKCRVMMSSEMRGREMGKHPRVFRLL